MIFLFTFTRESVKIEYRHIKQEEKMNDLKDILKNNDADYLFKCILKLENIDECYAFFSDLCTIREIQSMAQRITVAKKLTDGTPYKNIVEQTGVSTATISRVNRSLNYGTNGYTDIFKRVDAEEKK